MYTKAARSPIIRKVLVVRVSSEILARALKVYGNFNCHYSTTRQQPYLRLASLAFKCMTGCAPGYQTSVFVKRANFSTRTPGIVNYCKFLFSALSVANEHFIIESFPFGNVYESSKPKHFPPDFSGGGEGPGRF